MFNKKTVKDMDVRDKRVLVRVDFNVPIEAGQVADDTRIQAAMPTINYLLEHGAALILCSHLGRPKGEFDPDLSLKPVADYLADMVDVPVSFAEDCIGPVAQSAAGELKPGQILVLENTRFHAGEKANDPEMASQLASLADVFVNDALAQPTVLTPRMWVWLNFCPPWLGSCSKKRFNIWAKPWKPPNIPLWLSWVVPKLPGRLTLFAAFYQERIKS